MGNPRWRVLVIDDDKDVLNLLRLKLAAEYDVLCIENATDVGYAVELFEPDLIILDIMLPRISGYQIIEFLKRNPLTAKTPVCFLSAKASAREQKFGYSLGATLYLTKPFQPERLIRNIKLQFERMPPPARPKRHTLVEIASKLEKDGGKYHVATADTLAKGLEVSPREAASTPQPMVPPQEPETPAERARWEG